MKYPKGMVGAVFLMPYKTNDIEYTEKMIDRLHSLPYVKSTKWGMGCSCQVAVEIEMEKVGVSLFDVENELRETIKCITSNKSANPPSTTLQ